MNVLVVGPAKTGTTVVSKAIHQALPGSEYRLEPKALGAFVHPIGPPGVVVKIIFEHWVDTPHLRAAIVHNELPLKFDKVVAMLRDPRDELVSRLYFVARERVKQGEVSDAAFAEWLALLRAKEADPASISFARMCDEGRRLLDVELRPMPGVVNRYLEFVASLPKTAHVLRYEDFVRRESETLDAYIGRPISAEPDLGVEHYTRRSATSGQWRQIFTEQDVAAFRPGLAPLLAKVGYDDWDLEPQDVLDPAMFSGYVERLVHEVRAAQSAPTRRLTAPPVRPKAKKKPGLVDRLLDRAGASRKRR